MILYSIALRTLWLSLFVLKIMHHSTPCWQIGNWEDNDIKLFVIFLKNNMYMNLQLYLEFVFVEI